MSRKKHREEPSKNLTREKEKGNNVVILGLEHRMIELRQEKLDGRREKKKRKKRKIFFWIHPRE